jgi:NADH:ubiquinone reductase (H+-translocating)
MPRKQVVIIGGGFGGLTTAQSLREVDVVLIDRTNHHLFQPLLYQVATSALSQGYRVAIADDLSTVSACSRGHG